MERVSIPAVEVPTWAGAIEKRPVGDTLDTEDVAVNRYVIDPGDRLAGLHAHGDQEEVFVVLEGQVVFETLEGKIAVLAGEAIRFAPGEYKSGLNDAAARATVLALGAPRESADLRIPLSCPACGHEYRRPGATDDGREQLVCPSCGETERAACPSCGEDAMTAVRGEAGGVIGECQACGRTVEH